MIMLWSLLVALTLGQTPSVADGANTAGRVTGRVTVEGTRTPIAGVRIMLLPTVRPAGPTGRPSGPIGPIGPPPEVLTDQDGRFVFERLAPGTYRLDAQKTGFAPLDPFGARTVQVGAGQTTDGVDLQLQKGGVIAGKVIDAAGDPLPDARIMAMRRVSARGAPPRLLPAPGQTHQTNDLGEFRLAGLPPGEYVVAAMMPRSMPMFGSAVPAATASAPRSPRTMIATTFYPGTTDQAAAQAITVSAGATVNNIDFTMQSTPSFHVSGIVVDEQGDPVSGAMVMLIGDPRSGMVMGGPAASARAQDNGRFDMDDVPPGTYRANASIMISINGSGAGGSGGVAVGAAGVGSSGFVSTTFGRGPISVPADVVVSDSDVAGVRVTIRRAPPQ
jgi:protocatechuate 3,4-dioxygenase beta subunit